MKVFFVILIVLTLGGALTADENSKQVIGNKGMIKDLNAIEITIVYDNNPFDTKLKSAWGFSCFIEGLEKRILFDTGGDGKILLSNIKKLNINPKNIDIIFLSHEHWDHTGGLNDFLKENSNVVVYLLPSFPDDIKKNITNAGAKYVEMKSPGYLFERIGSTGELGNGLKEQSLIIETKKGLVIITGCAHPGIVQILKTAKEYFEQDIYMVIGGFHLGGSSDAELKTILQQFRKIGVKKAGPCHCSGDRCRELFSEDYQKDYIEIGVGKIIRIDSNPEITGGN